MDIFSKIKEKLSNEFIDIVEWLDYTDDTIAHRFERYQNEIKNNAKLIVREGQTAVFVNEGQIADVFTPGTYTLNTQNLPILTTLKGWKYGFNSPFKAEVYFVNTTLFTAGGGNATLLNDLNTLQTAIQNNLNNVYLDTAALERNLTLFRGEGVGIYKQLSSPETIIIYYNWYNNLFSRFPIHGH